MGNLTAIFIVGFVVLGIYKLFELFAKKKERMLMIEKLSLLCENKEDEVNKVKIRFPFIGDDIGLGFWPLRISMLLIGIGAGCLFAFFIHIGYYSGALSNLHHNQYDHFQALMILFNFASITFFGGIGLLIAFLIEQKMKRKK